MCKIAMIPIDNRPVCYELPQQIASLDKNLEFYIPPRYLLGDLHNNAKIEELFNWLENLKNIDIFVLSIDTIAYGGLIPSRRSSNSFETIKNRIEKLVEILKKHNSKIYAFSSIMRISNNNINEEEKEYWNLYGKKIFEYSYNIHKTGISSVVIPKEILKDYLDTRKRNFKINEYLIELQKRGIFDTLVFSKDDCSEYGLNVQEAELLKQKSTGEKNILIKTGADEIPLTLLSRAINSHKRIRVAPMFINPESVNKISKYEDISVKESVISQIELSGGIVSDENSCDMVLIVNNFKNEQGELVMNVYEPLFSKELSIPDKPYLIADILNANGSDNNFVKSFLLKQKKNFYGYSGWNTTGNTLGSVLSGALTYFKAKEPDKCAFSKLQITRFLDDWAYQANVREKIRNNNKNLSSEIVKTYMKNFENIIFDLFGINKYNVEYKFPWNRFFEIEIILYKC